MIPFANLGFSSQEEMIASTMYQRHGYEGVAARAEQDIYQAAYPPKGVFIANRRFRFSEVEFWDLPCSVGSFRWGHKIPEECRVFQMRLPAAIHSQITNYSGLTFDHFPGAFGVLRYYVDNTTVTIIEIQSDIFGQLRFNKERSRFNAWAVQTLSAFLDFIQRNLPNTECIVLVGPDYIRNRFPDIQDSTVLRFYQRLPGLFGFQYGYAATTAYEPISRPRLLGCCWKLHFPSAVQSLPNHVQ